MKILIITLAGWGFDEWDRWRDEMPFGMDYVPLWAESVTGPRGVVMEAPLLTSTYTGWKVGDIGRMDVWGRVGSDNRAVSWRNMSEYAIWTESPFRWELCNLPFTWPAENDVGGYMLPGMPFDDPYIIPSTIPTPEGWPGFYDLALATGTSPDPVEWRTSYGNNVMGQAIQSCGSSARALSKWFVETSLYSDIGWISFTFPHRLFTLWNKDYHPTWDSVTMMVKEIFNTILLSDLSPDAFLVYSPWGWEHGRATNKGLLAWSGFDFDIDGALFQYDVANVINGFLDTVETPEEGLFRDV